MTRNRRSLHLVLRKHVRKDLHMIHHRYLQTVPQIKLSAARFFFPPFLTAEPISARQPALRPHVHKQPEKTTRVRTVLNEKQLHTLRTCYNANPRPDALMKEQLVEMTGLSPRVIRVWFQNKRCKDKKRSLLMKQLQQQQPNDKTVRGRKRPSVHMTLLRQAKE